jgi:metallo-beta-lactamase family protein
LEPIYELSDVVDSLKQFIGIGYDRPYQVVPGVYLTFLDAGHILGSAIVVLDIEDEEQKRSLRLVFSGDLGRPNRPILNDPSFVQKADVLLIESTYGNRTHSPQNESYKDLENIVRETSERGGKVIVPAFAVGRTQELVYYLHQSVDKHRLPDDLPVFVDSPLAIDATGIYRLHPEAYDKEIVEFIENDKHPDPFGFDMMRYTRTVNESKNLNYLGGPAVIISASGMAEAGRILHHLKNNIEDPRNTILIVGWQAPNTLGRRLVERQPKVKIFGETYKLRAEVKVINGFSAHADRPELIAWADHINPAPTHTFLVHGEEESSFALADGLRQSLGFKNVIVPELGQGFTI